VSGKLYIYGGRDDESQLLNDIWNLDLSSQFLEWKDVTPRQNLSPNTRIGASLNSFRAKILICGGENCSSITSYDIKEQQWNNYKTTEKIPWSRTSNTTTIYKDKLILATDKGLHSITLHQKKNTKSTLDKDMKTFFKKKLYTDVSFIVEGKEMKAHKAFIAQRCPYFEKMFESGMKESQGNPIVVPENVQYDIFSKLLEYLYCDIVDLDEETAVDLLKLSNEYSVVSLKSFCEEFLVKKLSKENIIKYAKLAQTYTAPELRDAVLRCVNMHKDLLSESGEMLSLPKAILADLFMQKC